MSNTRGKRKARASSWSEDDFATTETWRDALKARGVTDDLDTFFREHFAGETVSAARLQRMWAAIGGVKMDLPNKCDLAGFVKALRAYGLKYVDKLAASRPCGACGEALLDVIHSCKSCLAPLHNHVICEKVVVGWMDDELFCNKDCHTSFIRDGAGGGGGQAAVSVAGSEAGSDGGAAVVAAGGAPSSDEDALAGGHDACRPGPP